ncbi:MAG: hypothetical protein ACW964_12340 [Candidatus Hodarchaeales archaeon]|jgi:hypothetical protein
MDNPTGLRLVEIYWIIRFNRSDVYVYITGMVRSEMLKIVEDYGPLPKLTE